MVNIGKRIQNRRKELKLSIDEIAKRLNKNRTTVYRYERGDIGNLPLETLKPLAEILETTPAYLMGWEERADMDTREPTPEADPIAKLINIINTESFTTVECDQLVEYAKFLIYRRNIK